MAEGRLDTRRIMEEVQENHRRLRSCARHQFPARHDGYRLRMRLTCLHCGGEMDLVDATWYAKGYAAHGGDPRDIIPDWPEPKR